MKRSSGILVSGLAASLVSTGALVGSGLWTEDTTSVASPATALTATSDTESTAASTSGTASTAASATSSATASEEAATDASTAATYAGEVVSSRYGDFQAQITVESGVITAITWLEAGEADPHSQRINEQAMPELEAAILEAQHTDVGYISGASYTSAAVEDAVLSAMQAAGLA
jgi:uncharacterized protein with FMN-binding domain